MEKEPTLERKLILKDLEINPNMGVWYKFLYKSGVIVEKIDYLKGDNGASHKVVNRKNPLTWIITLIVFPFIVVPIVLLKSLWDGLVECIEVLKDNFGDVSPMHTFTLSSINSWWEKKKNE